MLTGYDFYAEWLLLLSGYDRYAFWLDMLAMIPAWYFRLTDYTGDNIWLIMLGEC
jgi:hypothetical protein